MKISFDNIVSNYTALSQAREQLAVYELELAHDLRKLPALEVIDMIDGQHSFKERAEFVRQLLFDNHVKLTCGDRVVCDRPIYANIQWFACHEFDEEPYALKFLINAVYSQFLKQSAGFLKDSQEATPTQDTVSQTL